MDDQFLLDTPELRTFIDAVQDVIRASSSIPERLAALRPHFSALLADQRWLPDAFRQPDPDSGMGGGIATWLLYRAAASDLSFFALVVPPGASTPVHDHLAWGLVGLYVGEQDEEVYERASSAAPQRHDQAALQLVATNHLQAGTFYELIPPDGDIHRVTTTSALPSVSLHLLGNDTGCVWRHRFDPQSGAVAAFRSGYTNQPCAETTEAADAPG
jgi:predicted metal-dependent enzyme (double-stranded beta helix superfamily)